MEKIHSESGEVLIQVSPLIHFSKFDSGSNPSAAKQPLHVKAMQRQVEKQTELSPLHDFMGKLLQPQTRENLKEYVRWQASWRQGYAADTITFEQALQGAPEQAPVSINLDVTTACNYRCDHCVDMDILNKNINYDHALLKDSLTHMVENGLRSVIIIGGGEPTAYKGFEDIVRHLKAMNTQIGVVTNGSMMKKIEAVADVLQDRDWVRLSLDSGTNETFRAMHKPGSKKCTLEWICAHIPAIKKLNPSFMIGFSFIIVWKDCETNDMEIIENIDEMVTAAQLAKQHQFDYISYKPFLTRSKQNNAEVVGIDKKQEHVASTMTRIRNAIHQAMALEDERFAVVESTNLRVLENGTYMDYSKQPHNCHMQYFRQVLSPLGVFNCPVYRHVPQALLGGKHAYATQHGLQATQRNTLRLIETFDAAEECKDVTCLYNHANWFIEDLINHPEKLDLLDSGFDRGDYFL
ncbi:MAG: radical SAM protein [Gammaproteobacteria bacterium]|nr:radical SAM protein [Gammaproteobacteria bacterium]